MAGESTKAKMLSAEDVVAREHNILRDRARATPLARSLSAAPEGDASADYLNKGVFPTYGLSLSGGGIRSAAFCTGVVQALGRHKIYDQFDYLSTVSGGGYLGATLALDRHKNGNEAFSLLTDTKDEKKDSPLLSQLRDNANYLKIGELVPMLKNAAIYLRGLVQSLAMAAMVLFFLAGITLLFNPDYTAITSPDFFGRHLWNWLAQLGPFALTLGLSGLSVMLYLLWGVLVSWIPKAVGIRSDILWIPAVLLLGIALVFLAELQPKLIHVILGNSSETTASAGAEGKSVSGQITNWIKLLLGPAFAALVAMFGERLKGAAGSAANTWVGFLKRWSSRFIMLAALAVVFGLLWLAYLTLAAWGLDVSKAGNLDGYKPPAFVSSILKCLAANSITPAWFYLITSGVLFLLTWFTTPNANSLHRLYRDRLGEAFCIFHDGKKVGTGDTTRMSDFAGTKDKPGLRPIPIINTAINLQNSPVVKSKGRKADFFAITPYTIGSGATGYVSTRDYEKKLDGRSKELDLASAVAISGAAASSNMGRNSSGMLGPVLALFNVRMGAWLPNPKLINSGKSLKPVVWHFLSEFLGSLNTDRDRIYLTDGGHIENLGLYELLRRRCQLIVVVDGEADPDMHFWSFVEAQRFARIDLGARIDLKWDKIASTSLAQNPDKDGAVPAGATGPHCAIGTIEYDNGGQGTLIYIKSSYTGDENDYVRQYKRANPDFPHEATSDVVFDEEQFEAYRALGFHIANGVFDGKQTVQTEAGLESLTNASAKGKGLQMARSLLGIGPLRAAPQVLRQQPATQPSTMRKLEPSVQVMRPSPQVQVLSPKPPALASTSTRTIQLKSPTPPAPSKPRVLQPTNVAPPQRERIVETVKTGEHLSKGARLLPPHNPGQRPKPT